MIKWIREWILMTPGAMVSTFAVFLPDAELPRRGQCDRTGYRSEDRKEIGGGEL